MAKSKQLGLFPQSKVKREHGGSLSVGKRRGKRPLKVKLSHHITLKSYHAVGARSLFRHKRMILRLIKQNSLRFRIKVFETAIQGNHMHLLVKAQSRMDLQNFFRVLAGHSAQRILKDCPLKQVGPGTAPNRQSNQNGQPSGCKKNQRRFWSYLIYSRRVSWGREFKAVRNYIQKNTRELLRIIAYTPRSRARARVNSIATATDLRIAHRNSS
jgi:REP element-mobilizing transposase RayT